MSSISIFTPKKLSINLIIAKAVKSITKPIMALVIFPRAPSKACLSPPEEIQVIAPQINMKKKIKEPIMKAKIATRGRRFEKKEVPVLSAKNALRVGPKTGFPIGFCASRFVMV